MGTNKKHFELVGTMRLGPKGQVVIPADIRDAMQIRPGDKLVALYVRERNAISFLPESNLQALIDQMGSSVEELRTQISEQ